ncbi:HIRA-interacting protein 3 isoform X1 [Perca fluviatilis]|uniref:HIRA-interacting protein 3 isoform X1 n=1 Tax=Perca fluviatilis TaxID=8168 RepID=UPI0019636087|nr:HIRA-interacting protein 3 isoform X1 [Perca fluviatilis]
MKVSEKERAGIRRFVCAQLRDEPDLSTLTLGILKRLYLAHVGCESLSPEARNVMKEVVKEELMKMQEKDENGSELETAKPRNKRKRDKENDEIISGKEDDDDDDDDDESRAKKSRRQSTSSSESEDKEEGETGSEEEAQIKSEDKEQEVKNSKRIKNGKGKPQINSEDSSDEEINKSKKKRNDSDCDDRPKEMVIKRANATKTGETRSSNTSQPSSESDEENGTDTDSKSLTSEKDNGNDSSDDGEKEEKVSVEKRDNDPESDSSSLPSIEDEKNSGKKNSQDDKKKKTMKKEKSDKGQKQGDKAVVRLKHFISLCGLRPNYKKLLDGCRSVRSQVAVLKKELEELGVQGQPSVKKCKIVRMKREETQELAELDVSNIIATKESEDKEEGETGSEEEAQIKSESEDAEQEGKNSKRIKNGNRKPRINSEDSSDEEINKSKKKRNDSDCDDRPKEMVIKRANATKTGETRSSNTSQPSSESDEENGTDTDSKSLTSEKNNGNDSSDDGEKEEKVSVEKRDNDPESDSSSLPSIEDEKNSGKENSQDDKKKKTVKKEKSDRGQKQGDKAVVRLKRYISLCGLRPNYKKLLDGCRSVRSQVAVLKKELEELGVQGQPSVKKCKIVRMKREETQELAELDVSNIIATKGRPKRRAASAWQEKSEPQSSTYLHTLNSGSDSNEENDSHRGRRRTDWANLQGIISDDADSN